MLKGSDGRRRIVTAANRAAISSGIHVGMPLARAQVLLEGLVVYAADPQADMQALEQLARWALRRYSPITAPDAPDGLVIDITGAAHLHGGEATLLRALVNSLAAEGVEARAAAASTWGAAHAAARFGTDEVQCLAADGAKRLYALPVMALRLPPETVHSLGALGFDTIGEVVAQPRAPMVRRFGGELVRRLDQFLGHMADPIQPVDMPDTTDVERGFAEPIGAPETIARYTGMLAARLCDALEIKGLGVRQADLLFTRVDNHIEAIRIAMAQPMRDTVRLTRLLCDQIETIDPGFGIERMRLIATQAEPLALRQTSTTDDKVADLTGLIDTLSNRIGSERIYRVEAVESDVPERSTRRIPPLATPARTFDPRWPRPVRLFTPPEPIQPLARLPDHPPTHIIWRGKRHRVTAADGPERIFGEWWRRTTERQAVRDYFRVELESGERLWIYRSGDGEDPATGCHEWFLHGVFA